MRSAMGVATMPIRQLLKPGMSFDSQAFAAMDEALTLHSRHLTTWANLDYCAKLSPSELLRRQDLVSVTLLTY
jgi:hypothetical protein